MEGFDPFNDMQRSIAIRASHDIKRGPFGETEIELVSVAVWREWLAGHGRAHEEEVGGDA